jgi:hypothetical protein
MGAAGGADCHLSQRKGLTDVETSIVRRCPFPRENCLAEAGLLKRLADERCDPNFQQFK